jgi:hypothetical protein
LVQTRKSELGLRFHSDGDQRSDTLRFRSRTHSLEQRRLSDASLTPHDDRPPAVAQTIYKRVQDCRLLLALDQLGAGINQGRPAHRASMSAVVCLVQSTPVTRWNDVASY